MVPIDGVRVSRRPSRDGEDGYIVREHRDGSEYIVFDLERVDEGVLRITGRWRVDGSEREQEDELPTEKLYDVADELGYDEVVSDYAASFGGNGDGGGGGSALDRALDGDIYLQYEGAELVEPEDTGTLSDGTHRVFSDGALNLAIRNTKTIIDEEFYAPVGIDFAESWYSRVDISSDSFTEGDFDNFDLPVQFKIDSGGGFYSVPISGGNLRAAVGDGELIEIETLLTGIANDDVIRVEIEHKPDAGEVEFRAENLTQAETADHTTTETPADISLSTEIGGHLMDLTHRTFEDEDSDLLLRSARYAQEVSD